MDEGVKQCVSGPKFKTCSLLDSFCKYVHEQSFQIMLIIVIAGGCTLYELSNIDFCAHISNTCVRTYKDYIARDEQTIIHLTSCAGSVL